MRLIGCTGTKQIITNYNYNDTLIEYKHYQYNINVIKNVTI